jgi:hypothetical protein
MNIGTGTIVGLALLALAAIAVLALWFRFGPRDFLLMAAVCFPVVWFSRLDVLPIMFLGQHIPSHWLVMVGIIALTWPLGDRMTRAATWPSFRRITTPLFVLALLMFVSVLANGRGVGDLLVGLRAMTFALLPFFTAWSVIRAIRFDEDSIRRMNLMLFIVAAITAGLSVVSALAPQVFAGVLADPLVERETARGFTTLYGANTTGTALACIACVASGSLLAGHRRVLSAGALVLCFLGILTTLARAAMLAFFISQAYVFLRVTRGFGRRLAIFAAMAVFLLGPAAYRLTRDYGYSLRRLVILQESSAEARRVAMGAAFHYGLAHPFTGGGWGLLYPYGRAALGTRDLPSVWYVGNIATPVVKPHTLYGIVIAEVGVVGLVVLLLFLWRIWQALKPPNAAVEPRGNGLVAGYRACLLCMALTAVFQDDLFLLSKLAYVLYLASLTGVMANAYVHARSAARQTVQPAVPLGWTVSTALTPTARPRAGC